MRWTALALLLATAPLASAGTPARPAPAAPAHGVLPWIEDDYAAALAEARRADRPLFVEMWAPW